MITGISIARFLHTDISNLVNILECGRCKRCSLAYGKVQFHLSSPKELVEILLGSCLGEERVDFALMICLLIGLKGSMTCHLTSKMPILIQMFEETTNGCKLHLSPDTLGFVKD